MAGSLNKVILIGNLGADPEIREMNDGTKMAKFSIATSEKYTNREGQSVSNTDWHNIVLWRRTAEVAEKYLKKGDSVCIEGKLKTRSWEDENGVKKYATDIQGDSMTMLGSKRDSNNPTSTEKTAAETNTHLDINKDSNANTDSIENLPFEDNKTPF
tara:strand:- start:966 stop:1436 length:471 start_codon:yes stop_codon:yes gene_type:complete